MTRRYVLVRGPPGVLRLATSFGKRTAMANEGAMDIELTGGELEAPVALRGMLFLAGSLCIPLEGYTGGDLSGALILRGFVCVDGTSYIPVRGADVALATYLTGKGTGIRTTAAFEHLQEVVRNAKAHELRLKVQELLGPRAMDIELTGGEQPLHPGLCNGPGDAGTAPGAGGEPGDMSRATYYRHLRDLRARLPATKVVNVEVGAHVPWPVKVLLQSPVPRSKAVYMEASAQNVKGLKALVVHHGQREKKRRRSPLSYKPRGGRGERQYFSRRHRGYVQRTVSPSGRIRVLLVDPYILRTHRDCALLELSGDGEGSDS